MINTIPKTTRLTALEELLTQQLQESRLSPVPLSVNCLLGEVLLILIEFPDNYYLKLEKIEAFLYKILKQENLDNAYFIEIYYLINGEYCFFELEPKPSFLEVLAWQIFDKDRRIFIKKYQELTLKWYQKFNRAISKNFKSNQLSWLMIGGSLGTVTIASIFYGLTRSCVFGECPEIYQAEQLYEKTENLLQDDISHADLNLAKTNLKSAIKLLNKIPFWSDYYSASSQLTNQYQQHLNNILLIKTARNYKNNAILLSKKSPLSIQKLEAVKKEWQAAIDTINLAQNNDFLESIEKKEHKQYFENVDFINNKIIVEKQAKKSLKQANQAGILAQSRENSADTLSDLQLVYSTWKTAIKRLQEIQSETTVYESSRILLKTYLSNKSQIEKRKKQETIALTMYEKANKYSEMAKKSETNNQWSQAVNYWSMAIIYIKKTPQNTFTWNKINPLISTYNLSLVQAENKLNKITTSNKISSELEIMCQMKEKICNYQMTDDLIKIKLEFDYLEQLWMIALQAKAQSNLQIQVELLNHLSTFEYRLQTMSNQIGKSIEVYNAQGNLMTVYHRQQ
ncbi:MAG: hypothetical protein AB4063_12170 [Crocosphaera sp.]